MNMMSGEALGQSTLNSRSDARLPAQRPGEVLVGLSATDLALFEEFRASRTQARQPLHYTAGEIDEGQGSPPRRVNQLFSDSVPQEPALRSVRTVPTQMEALAPRPYLQREFTTRPEPRHLSQPEAEIKPYTTDRCMEDKSGSGVCDWCDRPGHEAIDCIKWDPVHFDKGVCVMCNNRLHSLDECDRFDELDFFDQAEMLLEVGRMKPGVRSVGLPWVSMVSHF